MKEGSKGKGREGRRGEGKRMRGIKEERTEEPNGEERRSCKLRLYCWIQHFSIHSKGMCSSRIYSGQPTSAIMWAILQFLKCLHINIFINGWLGL